ncbi:RHS repeat-associated core domain-containing protein [Rapidithrix thailandica]|uniref:RHS repeat-associated core domain-containing protein n=2 Tax=Rapidithrix thailandica TaxID=413964 RepID=A0AAW9RUR4_9BACT
MYNHVGNLVWQAELDIYGKIRTLERGSPQDCPFRYQGQYEDVETGLYYNRFRYYSPESGAYISQDPIGLAGNNPNIYAYTHDNNVWIDPWGLSGKIGNPLPGGEKIFRIGSSVDLKPAEAALKPAGISVIRASSAEEAGQIMKKAFPKATNLHKVIDSGDIMEATVDNIRKVGYDVVENPTNKFGDAHARLIHPEGADTFDRDTGKLKKAFKCS